MKHLSSVVLTAFVLATSSLCAQSVADDFNDNSRDASLWIDPYNNFAGVGQLDELGGRLEFSSDGSGETDTVQEFRRYPNYNQAWQVAAVVAMGASNFDEEGELGAVSLGMGGVSMTDGGFLSVGYARGVFSEFGLNGPAAVAATEQGETEYVQSADLLTSPAAIGVLAAYDPVRRLIQVYYDTDTDQSDGDWTLLETYTIDGSTQGDAVVLDWGMTDTDQFYFELNGYSTGPAVAPGTSWLDDFEFIPGRTVPTPFVVDDFNDNLRDAANWNDPEVEPIEGDGVMVERNGRLEVTMGPLPEHFVGQQLTHTAPLDSPWQVQATVSLSVDNFTADGQAKFLALEVSPSTPGDNWVEIGFGRGQGILPGGTKAVLRTGADDSTAGGGGIDLLPETEIPGGLPDEFAVRMTYDPVNKLIRSYYNLSSQRDEQGWVQANAFTINNTSFGDAAVLDWGMTSGDQFNFALLGGCIENASITSGTAWFDDFAFNRNASTALTENTFSDDFNDDSVDLNWGTPVSDLGFPVLTEENGRLEFTAPSGPGEHEISIPLTQGPLPRYDQAFEVKTEILCAPSVFSNPDQLAVAELLVYDTTGLGEIVFSIGAIQGPDGLFAIDNTEHNPGSEEPDRFEARALPEVIGLRLLWDPDAEIMRCYMDIDGNREVETWVLTAQYTLNGDAITGDFSYDSNWFMDSADTFGISLTALADGVGVTSGEVYFDNFVLLTAPLLTGFDLWASAIPDEGMRGQTDDASGNGIVNILQYLYGLDPLSTDTDVRLRIALEGGVPVMYHGVDETITDYQIWYQLKTSLNDPWTRAVGNEPTAIENVELNGKVFRKLTLPLNPGNEFSRIVVEPLE